MADIHSLFHPVDFIRNIGRDRRVMVTDLKAKLKTSTNTTKALVITTKSLQSALQASILTNTGNSSGEHYTGNPYKTYSSQVNALNAKYNLKADWGCLTAKNIIDVRAAFMIGRGVQVVKRDGYKGDADRELTFIRDFINFNNIDEHAPQDWAVGTEIEGKVLLTLAPALTFTNEKQIKVTYIPWRKMQYTITAVPPNRLYIKSGFLKWKDASIDSLSGRVNCPS